MKDGGKEGRGKKKKKLEERRKQKVMKSGDSTFEEAALEDHDNVLQSVVTHSTAIHASTG